ncbi:unnamed protein product [Protopolystoma xenopodis]|uniref:Uncharacterized protein n=1 Tax=Protopolystoma xenopodis TaxID=117903 RepID=A0A448WIP5_9PLAT|nr:unnamed protein product [Protopolystoma xenopodis]
MTMVSCSDDVRDMTDESSAMVHQGRNVVRRGHNHTNLKPQFQGNPLTASGQFFCCILVNCVASRALCSNVSDPSVSIFLHSRWCSLIIVPIVFPLSDVFFFTVVAAYAVNSGSLHFVEFFMLRIFHKKSHAGIILNLRYRHTRVIKIGIFRKYSHKKPTTCRF